MEIIGKALTTCQADPAGDSFRLNFEGVDGLAASLVDVEAPSPRATVN